MASAALRVSILYLGLARLPVIVILGATAPAALTPMPVLGLVSMVRLVSSVLRSMSPVKKASTRSVRKAIPGSTLARPFAIVLLTLPCPVPVDPTLPAFASSASATLYTLSALGFLIDYSALGFLLPSNGGVTYGQGRSGISLQYETFLYASPMHH